MLISLSADLWVMLSGLAVGLVLGLTGAGGGILAVPALVFTQGWSVAQAAPIGLLAVTGAAVVGTIEGFYRKLVRYRAAFLMACVGVPMTPLGLAAGQNLSAAWLAGLFGLVMLMVAARLFFSAGTRDEQLAPCHLDPQTGRLHWTAKTFSIMAALGVVTGFLTGLLGVGGGFILVPALRRFTDITMHGVVATSLMVVALVGGGSIIVSLVQGHDFPLTIALPFVSATAVGMLLGRILIQHLNQRMVQQLFAVLVLGVAMLMFYRAVS